MNILKNNSQNVLYRIGNIDSVEMYNFDKKELQPIVPFLWKSDTFPDLENRFSKITERTFDNSDLWISKLNKEYWNDTIIERDFTEDYSDEIHRIKEFVLKKKEAKSYMWEKDSYQISLYERWWDSHDSFDVYRLLDENAKEIWAFGVKRSSYVMVLNSYHNIFEKEEKVDDTPEIELEIYNGEPISNYLENQTYNPRNRSFKMKTIKR